MQILCPTDFSPSAAKAAEVAAAFAHKRNMALKLLFCSGDWIHTAEVSSVAAYEDEARRKLEQEASRLRINGDEVVTELRAGGVIRQTQVVCQQMPDLVVMASIAEKGGTMERLLTGSVTETVAESVHAPTLVVREPERLLEWLNGKKPLRVLCGIDFSLSADAAVAAVKRLFAGHAGEIEVEAVYLSENKGDLPKKVKPRHQQIHTAQTEVERPELTSLERDIWERLHDALGDMPIEVHVCEAQGDLAQEFVRLAEARKADLIVLGAHQRWCMSRLFTPSFSREVLSHSTGNVLCVPLASYSPEFKVPSIRRVLAATDFSHAGNETLRHAFSLLPDGGAVHVLHVCGAPSAGMDPLIASRVYFNSCMDVQKERDEAERQFESLVPRQLATSHVEVTTEVLVDSNIPDAICKAAERFGADAICVGSQGRSAVAAAILGSVTHDVLSRAHKPVFVVTPLKA